MSASTRGASIVCLVGVLVGCKTIDIYDPGANKSLEGIPFYTKIAVSVHDMAYAVPASNVQIVVMVATQPVTVYSFPEAPVNVLERRGCPKELGSEFEEREGDSRDCLERIEARLQRMTTPGAGESLSVQDALDRVSATTQKILLLAANSNIDSAPRGGELVMNTYHLDTELLGHRYYINSENPLIGSATADYHLNADGTLGEASTTISEQTASTFIGLVPVSAYLSKRWDLVAPAAAQTTTSDQATAKAFDLHGHFAVPLDQILQIRTKTPTEPKPPAVSIQFKRSPDRRVFLLRDVVPLADGGPHGVPVYTWDKAVAGYKDGSFQLVRIATESQLAKQPGDTAEKKKGAEKPADKPKDS